jgi:hypothetical protein
MLVLIAIVTGGALALMNLLGSYGSFSDAPSQYGASGVGLVADLGVVVFMYAIRVFIKRRDWFSLLLAVLFWGACSACTVIQGAKWLEHAFEAAQKPVEQQHLTEKQRQDDLAAERAYLEEARKIALSGKTPTARDNASKVAADARARINELEKTNTFTVMTAEPIRSPLSGYELLAAFVLWLASQGSWHMAFAAEATETESAARKRSGTGPRKRGAASPAARGQSLKSKENLLRPPMGQEAGQSGVIIPMRRVAKPRPSEIIAMRQSGMSQRSIGEAFGVSARTIRRILEGAADGAHAAQTA